VSPRSKSPEKIGFFSVAVKPRSVVSATSDAETSERDDHEGSRLAVSESYLHLTLGDLYGRDKCTLVGDVAGCDGAAAQNRLSRFDHSHQRDLSTGS